MVRQYRPGKPSQADQIKDVFSKDFPYWELGMRYAGCWLHIFKESLLQLQCRVQLLSTLLERKKCKTIKTQFCLLANQNNPLWWRRWKQVEMWKRLHVCENSGSAFFRDGCQFSVSQPSSRHIRAVRGRKGNAQALQGKLSKARRSSRVWQILGEWWALQPILSSAVCMRRPRQCNGYWGMQ